MKMYQKLKKKQIKTNSQLNKTKSQNSIQNRTNELPPILHGTENTDAQNMALK